MSPAADKGRLGTRAHAWALAVLWTLVVGASLAWNLALDRRGILELARTQARVAFDKDVLYRRWSAQLGGVYGPVTSRTPPNPYLKAPERDITSPQGRPLTLINPAYMTRMVHELGQSAGGVLGHITSLRPLRPLNSPDPWEAMALRSFEKGAMEASDLTEIDGQPYLRLMRPLLYEEACRACHDHQGYQLGQVRGGLSVSVPLGEMLALGRLRGYQLVFSHALLWALGLGGLGLAARRLLRREAEKARAEDERQRSLTDLRAALEQVRTLSGLLPICASCKRIKDERGQWEVMEKYITNHSQASFTHSLCDECAHRLYPELMADRPKHPDPGADPTGGARS